ncbi:hypothetical protein JAAARDRAFT_106226, partial [Jaapia argillacea MUCL 33604]
ILKISPELVDMIIDFVDEGRYVLRLALTCRLFKDILIPNHLHFRNISVSFSRHRRLDLLIRRPALARNVRRIRISDQ